MQLDVVRERIPSGERFSPFEHEVLAEQAWVSAMQAYAMYEGTPYGSLMFVVRYRETGALYLAAWVDDVREEFVSLDPLPWWSMTGRHPAPPARYIQRILKPHDAHMEDLRKKRAKRQYDRAVGRMETFEEKAALQAYYRKKGLERTARAIESGALPVASRREVGESAASKIDDGMGD